MAKFINLSTPDSGIANGMELSFRAPCDCSDVTGVTLAGVEYALVDASGESLSGCSRFFVKNAVLTVIIDTDNRKATLLNPRVNTYTKSLGTPDDTASANGTTVWARVKQIQTDVSGKAPSSHTHSKSEITDFAHNHDDRYFTEDEVTQKLNSKSNTGHTHVITEITNFPSTMPPSAHKHSKSEITDFPTAMPPTSHTHSKSEITDFPTSMPASDVYSWAKASTKPSYTPSEVGAAPASHTHTKSEIADFAHNHDDRYYTEGEVDQMLVNLGAGKTTIVDMNNNVIPNLKIYVYDGVLTISTSQ